jgi:hypothetical protein
MLAGNARSLQIDMVGGCRAISDPGRPWKPRIWCANSTDTGGTLTVTHGRHAAAVALLGNYMARGFVATADAIGGAPRRKRNSKRC